MRRRESNFKSKLALFNRDSSPTKLLSQKASSQPVIKLLLLFTVLLILYSKNVSATPTVNINTSLNNTLTSDTTPSINFNFTDSASSTANCTLYFNSTAYNTTNNINNNTPTTLTPNATISNGRYDVWINCTDEGGNEGKSETINITISEYINISIVLNESSIPINASVRITGHINDSNGNNITNQSLSIYINNSLINITEEEIGADWWNASWNYRTNISVESLVASNLNNTLVLVNFSTEGFISQGKMMGNCSDVRFVNFNNNELQYTMAYSTCNTSNTLFWVWMNLTGNSNNTIFVYYGNDQSAFKINFNSPDDNLVAYMHFDNDSIYGENSTKARDFSGYGNNATLGTGDEFINTTGGKYNGALQLDGDADSARITNSAILNMSQTMTIMAWVKLHSNSNDYITLAQQSSSGWFEWQFYLRAGDAPTSNYPVFRIDFDEDHSGVHQAGGTSILNTGTWYHVAGAYNGTHLVLYQDGVAGTPYAITRSVIPSNERNITLGWNDEWGESMNGLIDEFRLYNRSLSANEILAIYNSTRKNYNANQTTTATDSYGNFNYTFNAPNTAGTYEIKVNTSYNGIVGENTATLTVYGINITPTVNINTSLNNTAITTSIPSIDFNFTDSESSTASCTLYFNDTAYNTTESISNNTQTTLTANSSISNGRYDVYINCTDQTGNTGKSAVLNISVSIVLNISIVLNESSVSANASVRITGHINDSDGNNITNNPINIYINNSLINLTGDSISSGSYRTKIYIESLVASNTINSIILVNLSTSDLISQGKMRSDCGDTRFKDADLNDLSYTLETSTCNTTNTLFWVWMNLTGNSNNTIYAYYGNSDLNLPTNYTNPDPTLVFYAHFDNSSAYGENSTRVHDFSGYGSNGTPSGNAIPISAGRFGYAYNFSEGTDQINFTHTAAQNTRYNLTYLGWIKPANSNENGYALSKWNAQSNNGYAYMLWGNAPNPMMSGWDHTGGWSFSEGAWGFFAFVKNNTRALSYTNMVAEESWWTDAPADMGTTTRALLIGYDSSDGNSPLSGAVDEIRIYNRSLSNDELLVMYNSTRIHYISNESLIATDSNGNYNFTFNSPNTAGTYEIKVNTSYEGTVSENTATLTVTSNNIDACGNLSVANTTYTLINNVNSSGTCFNITANNITLDGQGFTITYAVSESGMAVYANGTSYLTIKNLIINQSNTSRTYSPAIAINNSIYNVIDNNTFWIDGANSNSYDHGIYFYNVNNSNITENDITIQSTCAKCYGTYLNSASYSTNNNNKIIGNNITMLGSSGYGIYAYSGNNTISMNTINVTASYTYGVWNYGSNNYSQNMFYINASSGGWGGVVLYAGASSFISNNITSIGGMGLSIISSYRHNITGNNIIVNGNDQYGIRVYISYYNNLSNNKITVTGTSAKGLYFSSAYNNTVYNTNIVANNTGADAIKFENSYDNKIYDSILNSTQGADINITSSTATYTNYLINCTTNASDISFASASAGPIHFQWYLDTQVNDSYGAAVSNANISAWQANTSLFYSGLTDSSGILRAVLTEYMQNYSGTYYSDYSNYTVNATKTGYYYNSTEINMTTNKQINFILASISSCPCPGAGNGWLINMADNCNVTANCDLGSGYLNFTGSGYVNLNATINCTSMQRPDENQIIYIYSNGLIYVN